MKRHRHRARRGYTLVFFAMFLFGFMALAALVIDVGFARLAQRQMQTAVDAAALEGLRFRDEVPDWLRCNRGCWKWSRPQRCRKSDYARRWLASRIVAWTFDDNLDPSHGDLIGFGAGPVVELTEGVGDPMLNAGQLLTLSETPFYKPRRSDGTFGLELNLADDMHGDMVAGEYDPEKEHWELPDYSREDFTPTPAGDAFLVRMRRTDRPAVGLDQVDNVSSHGPSIPYLFGRGALFPGGDPNPDAGCSPRHHGMSVRATAIADGTPALSAGRSRVSHELPELPGTLPFAIERSYWERNENGDENVVVPTDAESIIRVIEATIELYDPDKTTGVPIGFVIHADGESELRTLADHVSAQVPPSIDHYIRALVGQPGQRGYVVLIGDRDGPVRGRVIGFGYVDGIAYDTTDPGSRFVMTKRTGRIAAQNASAVPVRAVDPAIATDLIQENKNLKDGLLVPINRRTYGRRTE
jgi:hypothetical protein